MGRGLLDEGRTILPSSDPAFALVVITRPGFLGMIGSGSRRRWFDEVGIASGQPRVAEDGRERQRYGSLILYRRPDRIGVACVCFLRGTRDKFILRNSFHADFVESVRK